MFKDGVIFKLVDNITKLKEKLAKYSKKTGVLIERKEKSKRT